MDTKIRKKIIKEVYKETSKIDYYDDKLVGEKEVIQGILIEKVCEKLGYSSAEFYNENGKKLYKMLNFL